jgi:acetylornithine aminotransferase
MIGFDLPDSLTYLRKNILFKHHIFTGEAKPNTIRLLPSLTLSKQEADLFLEALDLELKSTVAL